MQGSLTSMDPGRQKKKASRWIAGTSRVQDDKEEDALSEDGPPKNASSELGQVMTKVLQKVMQSLRTKDIEARSKGLSALFWIIKNINEFVQEFRPMKSELATVRGLRMTVLQRLRPWNTTGF